MFDDVLTQQDSDKMDSNGELEPYLDDVFSSLKYSTRERKYHDRDGFLCYEAGSSKCLELGHVPDPENGWYDYDDHPGGWDGSLICPSTAYSVACTYCESEDCDGWNYMKMSSRAEFYELFTENKLGSQRG